MDLKCEINPSWQLKESSGANCLDGYLHRIKYIIK